MLDVPSPLHLPRLSSRETSEGPTWNRQTLPANSFSLSFSLSISPSVYSVQSEVKKIRPPPPFIRSFSASVTHRNKTPANRTTPDHPADLRSLRCLLLKKLLPPPSLPPEPPSQKTPNTPPDTFDRSKSSPVLRTCYTKRPMRNPRQHRSMSGTTTPDTAKIRVTEFTSVSTTVSPSSLFSPTNPSP